MSKCILHIGMHKTGTKSIQMSLRHLDDDRFYYARIGDGPNFSMALPLIFADSFSGRMKRYSAKNDADADDVAAEFLRDLKQSIATANGRSLVMSGEGIVKMSQEELSKLKAFLERHGYDDIEVIAYVRPPMAFVSSATQQMVKAGNNSTLRPEKFLPNYQERFAKFDAVFGEANVRLFKFDPQTFAGGDVVLDFLGKTGIPASSITVVRDNESITRLAAQLRMQYSSQIEARGLPLLTGPIGRALCNRLKPLDNARFRLAPSLVRPLVEAQISDVEWMERRLGQPLAEDLTDEEGDIHSTADLLQPIPGIDEKLRALLAEDGAPVDPHASLDTIALLSRIIESLKKRMHPERPKTAGSKPAGVKLRQMKLEAGAGAAAPGARPLDGKPGQARKLKRLQKAAAEGDAAFSQGGARKVHKAAAHTPAVQPKAKRADTRKADRSPLQITPVPLVNKDKNLVVLWSPKSACTTVYVWFSQVSGFSHEVRKYAAWPHKHRKEQFMRLPLYTEGVSSGMVDARVLKIIRNPYDRAVSIYRHALQTRFADKEVNRFFKGNVDAEQGYSFQTFLDLLEHIDMERVDAHFRPQFHRFELTRKATNIINISKSDLFAELNRFEEQAGLPRTDFADLNWLHSIERGRKASQEPIKGDALDEVAFSRSMAKLGAFPSYAQLLTPRARKRIEVIYKPDFDAYHEFL